jgi:hypothetical protein
MSHPVRGYIRPESCFATISQWEQIAEEFLSLQKKGVDTRGGVLDQDPKLAELVMRWFSHQLYVETQQFDSLTQKNVLDFIEDFVNHKVWGLRREFAPYFAINGTSYLDNLKIGYFYSRGDIEPYVLLDDKFTQHTYGTTNHLVTTMHWTSKQGLVNLQDSIDNHHTYAISTFTKQWKPFFRPESTMLTKLEGTLVAAFKSDVKSLATDRGNRAANLYRMAYPGEGDNLCKHVEDCTGEATSLWNEIIIRPTKIVNYKQINKY